MNRACLREAWTSPCHAGLKLVRHLYLHSEIYQIKRWASFTCACSSGSSFLSLWWRCFSNTWRFSTHMQEYSVCVCIYVSIWPPGQMEKDIFLVVLWALFHRVLWVKKKNLLFPGNIEKIQKNIWAGIQECVYCNTTSSDRPCFFFTSLRNQILENSPVIYIGFFSTVNHLEKPQNRKVISRSSASLAMTLPFYQSFTALGAWTKLNIFW